MSKPSQRNPTEIERRGMTRRALNRALATLPFALAGCATSEGGDAAGGPWHHTADGFRNPPGSPARGGDFMDWSSFFVRRLGTRPEIALPDGHVMPASEAATGLARRNGGDSITWLGHACFLIRLDGCTILTDPFLSDYASPLRPLGPKRFAPPGLRVAQLPPIDVVLLSHNHYDHLDLPTIEALAGKEQVEAVVPLRLAGYFTERGYQRVRELDWHHDLEVKGLTVRALPAIHFSKRTLLDRNQTLWTGYTLQGRTKRLYFAGDTAYGPIFRELGRGAPPYDLALLPIGAYEPRRLMQAAHANPEEAVQIGTELGARRLVGMHWGTIQLTDEPPFEPPVRFQAAARAAGYTDDDAWVMRIGETRAI